MRILMLSHGYPPTISGVTLVVQKVARAMVRRGHTVTVVSASERVSAYRAVDQGVRLVRVRSRENPFWADGPIPFVSRRKLRQIFVETHPDVAHTHEGAILGYQLARVAHEYDAPVVSTCHYLPRFVTRYMNWEGKLEELVEAVVWEYAVKLMNQFEHAVFPSQTQRHEFVEHGLSVPATVISNGVDGTRYHPWDHDDGDVEGRYNLPPGPRILFVGRLARDKEIEILLRAMALVSSSVICAEPPAHLLLVGSGDDSVRLQELARELGVAECVHFLGFVPEEDLPAIYRASDLFAIASTCEVQSIPALQAVATGIPIVAASAGALPELAQDGVNGFLVPPGDPEAMGQAILDLVSSQELLDRFGEASLLISRDHAEPCTFDAHEELYYRLSRRSKVEWLPELGIEEPNGRPGRRKVMA